MYFPVQGTGNFTTWFANHVAQLQKRKQKLQGSRRQGVIQLLLGQGLNRWVCGLLSLLSLCHGTQEKREQVRGRLCDQSRERGCIIKSPQIELFDQ